VSPKGELSSWNPELELDPELGPWIAWYAINNNHYGPPHAAVATEREGKSINQAKNRDELILGLGF